MKTPRAVVAALLFALATDLSAQESAFNMYLRLDTESADRVVDVYQGRGDRSEQIADLRGSQIAVATTGLLAQRALSTVILARDLDAARFNQSIPDDPFHITEARSRAPQIRELLDEIRKRNFGQKVVSTVEQLFPPGTRISASVPVYFVAFGHQNIDAFVRRVSWRGNVPTFVDEGEGELSIVVNLSKAVMYGRTVDERFIGMLSVVAHEVFHAAFGVYKDQSQSWRQYFQTHRTPLDQLLELTQNEGIAYYLSLIQRTHGRFSNEEAQNAQAAFADFNRKCGELLSPGTSERRAWEIVRNANTSGYWQSYGAMAGMIMARQIDQTMGRQALSETITNGPADFFAKYAEVMRRDSNVPVLQEQIIRYAMR